MICRPVAQLGACASSRVKSYTKPGWQLDELRRERESDDDDNSKKSHGKARASGAERNLFYIWNARDRCSPEDRCSKETYPGSPRTACEFPASQEQQSGPGGGDPGNTSWLALYQLMLQPEENMANEWPGIKRDLVVLWRMVKVRGPSRGSMP